MVSYNQYKIRSNFSTKFPYLLDLITTKLFFSGIRKIKNPEKILIIRNDHIGDMALATPVWRELKKCFPNSRITVLADPINKILIEKDSNVDEIIDIGLFWRKKNLKSLLNYLKILRKIRKERFDVGIDLRRSWLNIFLFLFLGKVKARVSYYNINGGKAFLTHPIFYDKKINVINENINLIEKSFNLKLENNIPKIYTSKEDNKDVQNFLNKNKLKKYILIAPGATIDSKQWPKEKYTQFIEKFLKKYKNIKILIAGGPDEKELVERLARINKKMCLPVVAFNLRQFSILCGKSELFIGNDGGADAIAWIGGAKNILLNGPVDMSIHLPLKNTITIHHILSCYPCDWSGPCPLKEKTGTGCIDPITVEEVLEATEKMLKSKKGEIPNEYWHAEGDGELIKSPAERFIFHY